MVVNRQKQLGVNLVQVRAFVERLRSALRLGRRDFNVCFVDDRAMERLNRAYRGKFGPTDVLSFPWDGAEALSGGGARNGELRNFLGDVVISVEMARRNARREGHSTLNEVRWLILHGLLHLLGYDHETDKGEMTRLEISWRVRLGIAAESQRPKKQGSVRSS